MILQLMKRDPAWKALPYGIAFFTTYCIFAGAYASPGAALLIEAQGGSLVAMMGLYVVNTQLSSGGYVASLPISLRDIYLARVFTLLGIIWIALALGLAAGRLVKESASAGDVLVPVTCGAVSTMMYLAVQARAVRNRVPPAWLLGVVTAILFTFAPLMLMTRAGLASPTGLNSAVLYGVLSVAVCAGAGLILVTWRTLPHAFLIGSRTESSESAESQPLVPNRGAFLNPLLRSLYPWSYQFWLVMLAVQAIQAGFIGSMMVGFVCVGVTRRSVRWLLVLPVPRRLLLAAILSPALLSSVSGYLVIAKFFRIVQSRVGSVENQSCGRPNFSVPVRFLRPVFHGAPPVLRSPQGETLTPPLVLIYGQPFYNPFAVSCESSQQFFNWQLDRAQAATLINPGPRSQLVHVACMITISLLFLLFFQANDWYLMRRLPGWLRNSVLLSLGGALFTFLVLNSFSFKGDSAVEMALLWVSSVLPGNSVVLALIPACILYWLLQRAFSESEYSDNPPVPQMGLSKQT